MGDETNRRRVRQASDRLLAAVEDLKATERRKRGVRMSSPEFHRLDEEVIDVVVGFASEVAWSGTGIDIHHMGGAFGRVPAEATAFPNRSAKYLLNIYGFWQDPSDAGRVRVFE